jgi:undecaprenyl-phosphate 4-deoxy-4-formamido-L-arabinose transferase
VTNQASISVVIPVHNASDRIEKVAARILVVLRGLGRMFELVFVNDGSRDDSWQKITALSAANPEIIGIDLRRNYGQHNALLCGIRAARHTLIATLDDDLQQPPEEIPTLLRAFEERDCDVIYGTPSQDRHGFWRNVASRSAKRIMRSALGADVAPFVSTFRLFRCELREAFDGYRGPLVSIDVLLMWATSHFAAVPVRHDPRVSGTSSYRIGGLIRHALNMATGFSVMPLQLASMLGFLCVLFGLAVLAFVVGRYFIGGDSVPGFPFLASIIAIFSGAQLFALGIIGEYLGRIHLRTMDQPPYSIRSTIQNGQKL